jgi:hypothetical protein
MLSRNNKFLQREKEAETARRVFFHPNGIDVCGLYFIVFAAILIYSSARFCVRALLNHLIFCIKRGRRCGIRELIYRRRKNLSHLNNKIQMLPFDSCTAQPSAKYNKIYNIGPVLLLYVSSLLSFSVCPASILK